ncbi:hypothetical protein E3V55_02715 [Candidatus Marinimicrobia bacterium MT.SAG.3]|nr:hypothetical protein E3V55_02715 [Candidatus Marinimicrobia bacterium MT.SAG.3]
MNKYHPFNFSHTLKCLAVLMIFFGILGIGNAQTLLKVKEIKIQGNESISDGKLKSQMNLREPGFLPFFKGGSEFNARILKLDRAAVRKYYERKGYVYAVVTDSFEIVNKKEIIIHLTVSEGKRVTIKEINIRGNDLIADTEILRMFESKLGSPLNPYLLRKDLAAVRTAYQNRGKPFAQLQNILIGDEDVIVVIDVKENDTVFIDSIIVQGTSKVIPNLVRRELSFKPSEKYSISKIEESQKRLFETGLFSNVLITAIRTDTVNRRLNLIISVRERRMKQIGGEFGFKQRKIANSTTTTTDFNIVAEWYNRNLFATGRLIRFKGNISAGISDISSGETGFEVSYTEPWIFGQRAPTTFRTFIEREQLKEPDIPLIRFGADIAVYKKYSEQFSTRLSQGITITRVSSIDSAVADSLKLFESRQRSINLLLINDKRKNIFFPTNGSLLSFDMKYAGGFLGGNSDLYRAELSWSRYQPFLLNKSWTLSTRIKSGLIKSFGDTKEIPFFDWFFLGGGTSVRGYKDQDLRDFKISKEIIVSEIYKLSTNVELRIPLLWRFGAELFLDGGNLWQELGQLSPARMRYAGGAGLYFMTPMGPARLDYGYKLNPADGDNTSRGRLHFGFLFAF